MLYESASLFNCSAVWKLDLLPFQLQFSAMKKKRQEGYWETQVTHQKRQTVPAVASSSLSFLILFLNQRCPCLFSNFITLSDGVLIIMSIFSFLHYILRCPLSHFSCSYLDTVYLRVSLSSTNIKYDSIPRTVLGTRDAKWMLLISEEFTVSWRKKTSMAKAAGTLEKATGALRHS